MKIDVFDNGHRSCNDKIINYASEQWSLFVQCPITEKIKTSIIIIIMIRSHTVMFLSDEEKLVDGGGGWQTKFNVQPDLGRTGT